MILLLFLAGILCVTTCFNVEPDLKGDGNIYKYAMDALRQLEAQKPEKYEFPLVIQYASSVCYGDLGCFDKEGTFKHLKQLPEPPETVNTQFLLYTRKNRDKPQLLDYKKPETVLNSNLDKTKSLKFITHGFGGRRNLTWVLNMKDAFLKMHDVNVFVVDWSLGARTPYYIQACVNSELVGAEVAVMYYFIKDNFGIQEKDLHLIGFSLGAHVVGFAGKRMMEMKGTRPGRTTGLDPAGPMFEEYGEEVHLFKDDADFVDIVHTNADYTMYGGVGINKSIGHVDFYPNGGRRQPGCGSTIAGAIADIFGKDRARVCNHERAVHLFTDSILKPDENCHFVGYKCSNYTYYTQAGCMNCGDDCGRMGYKVKGTGIYYLMTHDTQPYCTYTAKLELNFPKTAKKSYGSIIVTLVGKDDNRHNTTLTEKDEKLLAGQTWKAAIPLSANLRPFKSVEIVYERFNGWIAKGSPTFTIGQLIMQDTKNNLLFKTCEESVTLNDREYYTLKKC